MSDTDSIDPKAQQARIQSWSRYWASGALHSCPGSFRGNYDGSLSAYWLETFAGLTPGQRVLDLCTGNGAIPRWLMGLDGGVDRGLEVDAVDLAALKTDWVQSLAESQRQRLRIRAGVNAEALPFADACMDLVTSQYGIEYASLDRVFAEIVRVLKPGGRLQLLMHHAGSRPVQMGAVEAQALLQHLAPDGLLAAAAGLLPYLHAARDPSLRDQLAHNPQAEQARQQYNVAQQRIAQSLSQNTLAAPLLQDLRNQVQQVLQIAQIGTLEQATQAFQKVLALWQEAALRLAELVSVAADDATMQQRIQHLQALGFSALTLTPVHYQQHLMGWALKAVKPVS